jgi:hypothetical protein
LPTSDGDCIKKEVMGVVMSNEKKEKKEMKEKK